MEYFDTETGFLPMISAGDVLVFTVKTSMAPGERAKYREVVQAMLDEAGLGDRKFLVVDQTMDVSIV